MLALVQAVPMLTPSSVFGGPVLLPNQYECACSYICLATDFSFKAKREDESDLYPEIPLHLSREHFPMVFLIGIVEDAIPNRFLLMGRVHVAGFRDMPFSTFVRLPFSPHAMDHKKRLLAMNSLCKKLRKEGILSLAHRAQLMPYEGVAGVR